MFKKGLFVLVLVFLLFVFVVEYWIDVCVLE